MSFKFSKVDVQGFYMIVIDTETTVKCNILQCFLEYHNNSVDKYKLRFHLPAAFPWKPNSVS